MANNVFGFTHSETAVNLYALIRDRAGQIFDATTDLTFEAYATDSLGDYDIALTEQGTASRHYTFTVPSQLPAGAYSVKIHKRAGGSPAEGDLLVGNGVFEWDGSAILPLSSVAARLPAALTADGNIKADVLRISGDAAAADNLEAILDGTGGSVAFDNFTIMGTFSCGNDFIIGTMTVGSATVTGAFSVGSNGIPWNAAWDAEVQSEVEDGLNNLGYSTTVSGRIDAAITSRLAPTTSGRTLDVTATGEAGIDWANIGGATSTVNLSGTTVKTATDVEADTQDLQSNMSTILSRLTSARAGYLDNLNVGGVVASQADITALNQSASRRIILTTVMQYERPESGTSTYTIEARTYDGDGAATNADSTPTLTATGIVSGDLSANLSAASNPATGVYRWTYTVANGATLEQVRMDVSATIASATFTLSAYSQVTDFVSATWTASDASKLTSIYNKLPSKAYLAGTNNSDGDVQMDEATGNFGGSVASVVGNVGEIGTLITNVAAIKAKTDSLGFTVAGQADVNVRYVNSIQVDGSGTSADPWRPA